MSTRTETYEFLDPEFGKLVNPSEPLKRIWTGGQWTEGPLYSAPFRSVIFSDIPNDRRLRYDELTGEVGDHLSGVGRYTNGSTLDTEGRIISCEHGTRSVTRFEHDGRITTLADSYQGKPLNSPNDVVVKRDGSIWFTDPSYGIDSDYEGFAADMEQDGCHVYRIDPSGSISQVTTDMVRPNGLAFSLDEKTLYVADTGASHVQDGPRHIRAFNVDGDRLTGGDVFCTCEAGFFDGFRLDNKGRIWSSTQEGVHVFATDGSLIGKIFVPEVVGNLVFGGPKRNLLYITASYSLYVVRVTATGAYQP